MISAAPGVRIDEPKVVYVTRNAGSPGTQYTPTPQDSCYRYVDPDVANPGAMRLGCEDYVKKYKGKVQR